MIASNRGSIIEVRQAKILLYIWIVLLNVCYFLFVNELGIVDLSYPTTLCASLAETCISIFEMLHQIVVH